MERVERRIHRFWPSLDQSSFGDACKDAVTPPAYCPGDSVSRLQMAAFMNRLGTALTRIVIRMEVVSGALNLDLTPVACATADVGTVD